MWGRHLGAPTLSPIAVRMASLDIRRPSDETGGVLYHAPDSLEQAPSKRARDDLLVQWAKRSQIGDGLPAGPKTSAEMWP